MSLDCKNRRFMMKLPWNWYWTLKKRSRQGSSLPKIVSSASGTQFPNLGTTWMSLIVVDFMKQRRHEGLSMGFCSPVPCQIKSACCPCRRRHQHRPYIAIQGVLPKGGGGRRQRLRLRASLQFGAGSLGCQIHSSVQIQHKMNYPKKPQSKPP